MAKRFYCTLVLKLEKTFFKPEGKILSQYQLDTYSYLPMALARCLTLLIFLTSVLTPKGSPGRCTDTLASTLSCPSVRREKEGSDMRITPNSHYSSPIHSFQNPCLTNSACIWIWMIYLHEIQYSGVPCAPLNSLQQINNLLYFASGGFD